MTSFSAALDGHDEKANLRRLLSSRSSSHFFRSFVRLFVVALEKDIRVV